MIAPDFMVYGTVLLFALAVAAPEKPVSGQDLDGATPEVAAATLVPKIAATCPSSCVGEVFSVWRFPPGTRRATDPPGTTYANGWKEIAELGEVVTAVFDQGVKGTVAHAVYCRPWADEHPHIACFWEAKIETADVFADGFESGDLAAWSVAVP